MNKDINIKRFKPKFIVDNDVVVCSKSAELNIFGQKKYFKGNGFAVRTEGNAFNQSFGEFLSEVRADQDIDRQLEMAGVKFSFDHFLDKQRIEVDSESLRTMVEGVVKTLRSAS
jgi:hypothetical protein